MTTLDASPEAVRREQYAEAFRQIAARIEIGDVPLPGRGNTTRVCISVEDMTPGEYAVAALAIDADMEVVGGEAWASRDMGAGVLLTLCAPVNEVTIERPVVTPERVFATPPASRERTVSLLPQSVREGSEMYRGHHLSPGGGLEACVVVRGAGHRIVHHAASMSEAKAWVRSRVPVLELDDDGIAA